MWRSWLTRPKLVQDIELDEELFAFDEKSDVFSITNVLKQCEAAAVERADFSSADALKISENCLIPSSRFLNQNASSIRRTGVGSGAVSGRHAA